ncbi:MAG: glycerophosphodiester phosphodiesterase family protein [Myxococcota bacterium]
MIEQLSRLAARTLHRTAARLPGRPSSALYTRGTPLILAHRGARTRKAENTVGAFVLGMEQGADGVELDVHLTADRRVVVFHDEDLRRLGQANLRVRDLTLKELQAHDVGGLVKGGPPERGVAAPALEEVFATLPSHAIVNVELKGGGPVPDGLEVEVLRTVARARAEDRVIYSAFHPIRCARLRRLAPDAPVAMLHEEEQPAPLRDLWLLPLIAPHAVHPQSTLCDAGYVEHARALGLAVHVWTVNDPAEMQRLAGLGVDAIITDVPDVAVATLRRAVTPADTPP